MVQNRQSTTDPMQHATSNTQHGEQGAQQKLRQHATHAMQHAHE
jgi:hypothetical protein